MRERVRSGPLLAALAALVLVVVAMQLPEGTSASTTERPVHRGSLHGAQLGETVTIPKRPNIVMLVMDDFSLDLLPAMRHAAAMRRTGASYENAFVVDSLCCVSRSSILTGQYPHQTGVLTNTANLPNPRGPIGGWKAFEANGNEHRSVNVRLHRHGYTTGFVGKFLNQYEVTRDPDLPVPPGWDTWNVLFGSAYDGWGFTSSRLRNGEMVIDEHPAPPASASDATKDRAYAGRVVQRKALRFIRRNQRRSDPYFLVVAPYGPHSRVNSDPPWPGEPLFAPEFRDRLGHRKADGNCGPVRCRDLDTDDLPGYGDDQSDNVPYRGDGALGPDWKGQAPPANAAGASRNLRNRARMVQSIDRMLARILRTVDDDTYVVLTSDNGYHLDQHGLVRGKGTPYDSDTRVPLVVTGPGVVPGSRSEMVNNIDLAPTVEELAGLRPAGFRSGVSFAPTLFDPTLDRTASSGDHVFFEHTWAPSFGPDPDKVYAGGTMDRIPSYVAVRSRTGLLVRLDVDNAWDRESYAWEYYDYRDAPYERTNSFTDPTKQEEVARLRDLLERFDRCAAATGDDHLSTGCRRLTE